MDFKLSKPPFVVNGIHWSTANRWILGTPNQAIIASPQCTVAGSFLTKREAAAILEPEQNIEAVCILDELPSSFLYSSLLLLLATDSSIRIFAPKRHPELENWKQVGSGQFKQGGEHICCIAATVMAMEGGPVPVVAGGSMNGKVSVIGLGATDSGCIEGTSILRFTAHLAAISYLAWVPASQHKGSSDESVLVVGSVNGAVDLWSIKRDLSQATAIMQVCDKDWRPVTAHSVGNNMLALAKLGQLILIDISANSPTVHKVDLEVTQTIVACAIDEPRGCIYIGAYDFEVIVIERQGNQWTNAHRGSLLRDSLKKTIVRSFTTKFNIQRLLLRGMSMSPNNRYLVFTVDDQVNWDIIRDGPEITRMHFHQLSDWSMDDSLGVLKRIVDGQYQGDLGYNLFDILNGESTETLANMMESVQKLKGDQFKPLAENARDQAFDYHVVRLFEFISEMLKDKSAIITESDRDTNVNCPVCQTEMSLLSKQTACCTRKHIFDVCSVTLNILKLPGSDQCNTCLAKRSKIDAAGSSENIISRVLDRFSHCSFCNGNFYSGVV
ncbi:hypothetical protein EV183_000750 [Coemansia sp. RSA 2336]|nr:hypothetical protein EV183_000750 [Coemansia sp. RSA 2336]